MEFCCCCRDIVGGEDVTDEEPDSADYMVTESTDGVDFDIDTRRFAGEELRRHFEEEFIAPCMVLAFDFVDLCSDSSS
ncbi:hypothetical protein A2U01_0001273 [Trifolium medium]|uniref:Uncharacterized protein n=1 Tax=Trifolium medium TaxID=97028 RepID=A0A392M1M0_9FABA|nr:hypothetical protein [Trifolium medium]